MISHTMLIYKEFSVIPSLPLIKENASEKHNYFNWSFQGCEYDLKWSNRTFLKLKAEELLIEKQRIKHIYSLEKKKIKLQKLMSTILLLKMIMPLLAPSSQVFVMFQTTAVKKDRWSWIN